MVVVSICLSIILMCGSRRRRAVVTKKHASVFNAACIANETNRSEEIIKGLAYRLGYIYGWIINWIHMEYYCAANYYIHNNVMCVLDH